MRSELLEKLDFLSDHWIKGDDRPPFNFGGWREEVADDFIKIYRSYLADARREGHELGRAELVEFEVEKARREERANIIDLIQDEHNFTWVGVEGMCLIKDIVATLREEEGAVK